MPNGNVRRRGARKADQRISVRAPQAMSYTRIERFVFLLALAAAITVGVLGGSWFALGKDAPREAVRLLGRETPRETIARAPGTVATPSPERPVSLPASGKGSTPASAPLPFGASTREAILEEARKTSAEEEEEEDLGATADTPAYGADAGILQCIDTRDSTLLRQLISADPEDPCRYRSVLIQSPDATLKDVRDAVASGYSVYYHNLYEYDLSGKWTTADFEALARDARFLRNSGPYTLLYLYLRLARDHSPVAVEIAKNQHLASRGILDKYLAQGKCPDVLRDEKGFFEHLC